MNALRAPVPLAGHHRLENFDCGEDSLNQWLRRRARANQESGASRTFVACDGDEVAGYYALASGAITVENSPGKFRRNMPDPIPVVVLARLGVDQQWQGKAVGRGLFRDAALRVAHAASAIGIRGIVVHALSEQARNFYIALGFEPSPRDPMMLMVTLKDIQAALA